MQEKLESVLEKKKWGQREKDFIRKAFRQLNEDASQKEESLLDFIEHIKELETFDIVMDVNQNVYFKKSVTPLSDDDIIYKKRNPNTFGNRKFFRKVGEQYILDRSGDYALKIYGYYDPLSKTIAIFEENLTTFFHEYEHSTQKGFIVDSPYFGSEELSHLLLEGDATDYEINTQPASSNLQFKIFANNIYYFREYYLFLCLKLLLGEDFIKTWKNNLNQDFFASLCNTLGKKEMQEFLTYYFVLDKAGHMSNSEIAEITIFNKKIMTQAEKNLGDLKKKNLEIDKIKEDIIETKKNLTDEIFLDIEAKKRKTDDQHEKEELDGVLTKIKTLKENKLEIKEYILSLRENYDEKIDYEKYIKSIIKDYEEELNSNYQSNIKDELKEKISFLERKLFSIQQHVEKMNSSKNIYQKIFDTYKWSLSCSVETQKLLLKYYALNKEDKKDFLDNILLRLQILVHSLIVQKIKNNELKGFEPQNFRKLLVSLPVHYFDDQIRKVNQECTYLINQLNSLCSQAIKELKSQSQILPEQEEEWLNLLTIKHRFSKTMAQDSTNIHRH